MSTLLVKTQDSFVNKDLIMLQNVVIKHAFTRWNFKQTSILASQRNFINAHTFINQSTS